MIQTVQDKCHMIEQPAPFLVHVVYIAVTLGTNIDTYARRFADTYKEFPAGENHRLTIACNGGKLAAHRQKFFEGIDCDFLIRPNDGGKDISAYQDVADATPAQFMVCLGESVYFHRAGWLRRVVESRLHHGPGIYGFFSSHFVRAHLNTTAFGVDVAHLRVYPRVITQPQRYNFEHGPTCLWHSIHEAKGEARLVTWDGCWRPGQWRMPPEIMHKGSQSNCLAWCNHTERFHTGNPHTRDLWTAQSNSTFTY